MAPRYIRRAAVLGAAAALTPHAADAQYARQSGSDNPLGSVVFSGDPTPALADLNGDGLLDVIVGLGFDQPSVGLVNSRIDYFENTGTASAPAFAQRVGADNPFDELLADSGYVALSFGDVDGDGDLDAAAVTGSSTNSSPQVAYLENTGAAGAPAFALRRSSGNPFSNIGLTPGTYYPELADLNGDGLLDLILGDPGGKATYYVNTGTATAPAFTESDPFESPFEGLSSTFAPRLADLDADGDLDLVSGTRSGALRYAENVGTPTAPDFEAREGGANPFAAFAFETGASNPARVGPAAGDLDGDGDIDVLVGVYGARTIAYLEADGIVPVELTTFEAVSDGDAVLLRWATASETSNAGFHVERVWADAAGVLASERMGWIGGAGTTAEAHRYSFRTRPLAPGVHRFRLRQVDLDGAFEFSPTVEVAVAQSGRVVAGPFPQPAAAAAYVLVTVPRAQPVRVTVVDLLGREALAAFAGDLSPTSARRVDLHTDRLAPGTYRVRVAGETFVETRALVVVR